MRLARLVTGLLAGFCALVPALLAAESPKVRVLHAIAHHGEPRYGKDAIHLDHVRPDAPKGGELRLQDTGGFDSFNPFIVRGNPAPGLGLIYETLMESPPGESLVSYGLIAESVELPDDHTWVAFNLRPEARFHDGKPVTADDVVWTFETLKAHGRPFHRLYYANVAKAEAIGPHKVKFTFQGDKSLELPIIIGQLPVLPKHYWASREFDRTTLEPPTGSGAYRIREFEANRFIVYERVPDHWSRDLMLNRGRYNFDRVRYDSYRDTTVILEAFKAGEYDFRLEHSSRDWATGYDFPAMRAGHVLREEVKHGRPTGMQAFVFNTRRARFQDPKVREAFAYAFDFEWTNRNLFYGFNSRTKSYYSNSDFAARGLPSEAELKLLGPHRDRIPPEVFIKEYAPPSTDGSGNIRENLRIATRLLTEAGWRVQQGVLVNGAGERMELEVLLVQPEFERIVAPYIRNLERLGVRARIRVVDTAQYQNRVRDYDFDMVIGSWPQSEWPGNEQRDFWGSAAADRPAGRNLIGIRNPVVDDLVEKIAAAPDRDGLIAATRALDR
ncbi:MAG: ABC transporter substrate-binding protein, partial [Alphaproteobacteria bacterium]|nr:ABC transporter substrate-binding protein [Alphaproteobacteria bacterium]